MSQVESQIREAIVQELAGKIGKSNSAIKQIIHHSSTRREEGAVEDSDIDLCLVLETHPLVYTNLFREALDSHVSSVLDKHGLKLGTDSLQVHLTLITEEMIADPMGMITTDQGREALTEVLTKGILVYNRQ